MGCAASRTVSVGKPVGIVHHKVRNKKGEGTRRWARPLSPACAWEDQAFGSSIARNRLAPLRFTSTSAGRSPELFAAARILDIDRVTLYNKIRKYHLREPENIDR